MRLIKRTYALPPDTLEQFEQTVSPGKRSAIIADLMREWVESKRREQLRSEVVAGCHDMAEIYLETAEEFLPLEEEVHRAIDA